MYTFKDTDIELPLTQHIYSMNYIFKSLQVTDTKKELVFRGGSEAIKLMVLWNEVEFFSDISFHKYVYYMLPSVSQIINIDYLREIFNGALIYPLNQSVNYDTYPLELMGIMEVLMGLPYIFMRHEVITGSVEVGCYGLAYLIVSQKPYEYRLFYKVNYDPSKGITHSRKSLECECGIHIRWTDIAGHKENEV